MDYLTLGLGAAGAVVVFFAETKWRAWRDRPKRNPSPTLDEAVFLDSMAAIRVEIQAMAAAVDRFGQSIVATTNPAGMTPVVILLEKILGEATRSVAQMEMDQERDGHIRSIAEAITTPRGDQPAVVARLDELQRFLQNQDALKIQALDALVLEFSKFAKHQTGMFNALFNGGSISTVDEESAAREEKIQALMRRYGLSHEVAEARVRGTAVYEPNTGRTGMRENS